MKTVQAWAVICPWDSDHPTMVTIAYTKSGSIKKLVDYFGNKNNWRWFHRRGWRCEKITIRRTITNCVEVKTGAHP